MGEKVLEMSEIIVFPLCVPKWMKGNRGIEPSSPMPNTGGQFFNVIFIMKALLSRWTSNGMESIFISPSQLSTTSCTECLATMLTFWFAYCADTFRLPLVVFTYLLRMFSYLSCEYFARLYSESPCIVLPLTLKNVLLHILLAWALSFRLFNSCGWIDN